MSKYDQAIAFIRELYGNTASILLHEPRFRGNEKNYLVNAIDSTFVSSVGPYVNRFEDMMSGIAGTQRAVAVVNGTAALQIALQLAGVKAGEEVLTQALTFIATTNAVAYNRATPVFLDVDLDTMGLSPRSVGAFLEEHAEIVDGNCINKRSGRRIAACLPMHTFGFPVHLNELKDVCDRWGIPIVEDAAEALGSEYRGRRVGGFGMVGAFSFNGNKIVTSGGGGAIVTNDKAIGDRAKHLTTTAKIPHAYEYAHDEIGYNFRMPNINAALACAQLEQLDGFLQAKRSLAFEYHSHFQKHGIRFRTELPGTKANYWLMCVELDDRDARDEFLRVTNRAGVNTRPIWELMFRLPMYSMCFRDEQRNAAFLADRIVNIPSSVI